VDSLFRQGVRGYETIPSDQLTRLEQAQPPFDSVRFVLATHRHADHFDAASVAAHLAANEKAEFWGTPQTADAVRTLHPQRVRQAKSGDTFAFDGGSVRFILVPHNAPHLWSIENVVLIVTYCGQTMLFTGDAETTAEAFAPVTPGKLDAVFVPWWFLTGTGGRQIVDRILRPRIVWAVHGDITNQSKWQENVLRNYPEARIAGQSGSGR
jgi:L-ascorbate metabolism protein UlaG (beta-lactamase superfamily)